MHRAKDIDIEASTASTSRTSRAIQRVYVDEYKARSSRRELFRSWGICEGRIFKRELRIAGCNRGVRARATPSKDPRLLAVAFRRKSQIPKHQIPMVAYLD